MTTNWILALVGIMIYFITKYAKRRKKTIGFNLKFWAQDNWPEIIVSLLATYALMVIFMSDDAVFDLDYLIQKIPGVVSLPIKMVVSLLIGFGNSALFYAMFKVKTKK